MNKKTLIYLGVWISILSVVVAVFLNLKSVATQEEDKKDNIEKMSSGDIVFKEYRADIYEGDYIFGEIDNFYKEKIIKNGPNFAGHYYFYTNHCGTMCQENNYINLKTGEIKTLESSSPCIDYSVDSNLLIIDGKECIAHFKSEGIPTKIYFPSEEAYYLMKENGELMFLKDININEREKVVGDKREGFSDTEIVVERFYTFWLSYDQGSKNPNADQIYRNSLDVTESFILKMDKMYGGPIGYDPITCSQDPPFNTEKTEFKELEKTINSAKVNVIDYNHLKPNSIMVYLKLVDGLWKINDIECVHDDQPKG